MVAQSKLGLCSVRRTGADPIDRRHSPGPRSDLTEGQVVTADRSGRESTPWGSRCFFPATDDRMGAVAVPCFEFVVTLPSFCLSTEEAAQCPEHFRQDRGNCSTPRALGSPRRPQTRVQNGPSAPEWELQEPLKPQPAAVRRTANWQRVEEPAAALAYSPGIQVADWPKVYTLDQNRTGINARLVLEIVCNRPEGARNP
jgi:hypothetical protein